MAVVGIEPVEANPLLARRALEEHLARRQDDDPDLERVDDLVLHIPLKAVTADGAVDEYVLRLDFRHYPVWPPSAQFVDPETGMFVAGQDNRHLPRIEGSPELYVHSNYQPGGIQLICSSATLEFYAIRHSVGEAHIWREGTDTFWRTIHAVQRHLRPPWYLGRQG